jgi:hypothetical protein
MSAMISRSPLITPVAFVMARSLLLVDGEEAGVAGTALPLGHAEQVAVAIWHWL